MGKEGWVGKGGGRGDGGVGGRRQQKVAPALFSVRAITREGGRAGGREGAGRLRRGADPESVWLPADEPVAPAQSQVQQMPKRPLPFISRREKYSPSLPDGLLFVSCSLRMTDSHSYRIASSPPLMIRLHSLRKSLQEKQRPNLLIQWTKIILLFHMAGGFDQ